MALLTLTYLTGKENVKACNARSLNPILHFLNL